MCSFIHWTLYICLNSSDKFWNRASLNSPLCLVTNDTNFFRFLGSFFNYLLINFLIFSSLLLPLWMSVAFELFFPFSGCWVGTLFFFLFFIFFNSSLCFGNLYNWLDDPHIWDGWFLCFYIILSGMTQGKFFISGRPCNVLRVHLACGVLWRRYLPPVEINFDSALVCVLLWSLGTFMSEFFHWYLAWYLGEGFW